MEILAVVLLYCASVDARTDSLNGADITENCYDGAYRVKLPPFDACSGFRKCEMGHYCTGGSKYPCPAGTFGNTGSLNSSKCTGPCPDGFYCPVGTSHPFSSHCGSADLYCPEGSAVPTASLEGYYTVDPQGSDDVNSASSRSAQKVCPRGHYCTAGVKYLCPGGTYGTREGLDTAACSGMCPEGWYCPAGSTQPYLYSCLTNLGTEKTPTGMQYCPEGSTRPIPTAEGYYTIAPHVAQGGGFGAQVICPRGSFCLEGLRHLCPAGRYGVHNREINASCTGPCTAGFYCPQGSISDKEIRCPDAASYCPASSSLPSPVSTGYYTVSHEPANYTYDVANFDGNLFAETARTHQSICEPGYYCLSDGKFIRMVIGILHIASFFLFLVFAAGIKRKCPVGRYGSTRGLSSPSCSGYCAPGYYCEEGSPVESQYPCGGPDRFCPPGSTKAQMVHVGYYTGKQCIQ